LGEKRKQREGNGRGVGGKHRLPLHLGAVFLKKRKKDEGHIQRGGQPPRRGGFEAKPPPYLGALLGGAKHDFVRAGGGVDFGIFSPIFARKERGGIERQDHIEKSKALVTTGGGEKYGKGRRKDRIAAKGPSRTLKQKGF